MTRPLPRPLPRPRSRRPAGPRRPGRERPRRPGRPRGLVRVRPLRPDDRDAFAEVFAGLSPHSRRLRFHAPVPTLTSVARAALLDAVDGDRHVALLAEAGPRRRPSAVGIARYVVTGPGEAELAVEVVDAWQGRGVGGRLLDELRSRARAQGLQRLHGTVVPGNDAILALLRRTFPGLRVRPDGEVLEVTCPLTPEEAAHDDLLGALVPG